MCARRPHPFRLVVDKLADAVSGMTIAFTSAATAATTAKVSKNFMVTMVYKVDRVKSLGARFQWLRP